VNARRVARDALVRVEGGAYSHVLLPHLLRRSRLSRRDRAFVTELVYGTLRAQRRVDALLEPYGRRPLSDLDAPVRAALRLGVFQLLIGTPAHAAVGETVAATPRSARGYVNAVLRALADAGPPWPDSGDTAVALSMPDWIVTRLVIDLGEDDALGALAASNEPAAMTFRTRESSREQVERELTDAGAAVAAGTLVPSAVVARGVGDPAALPAVAQGRATPQDEASQAVVAFLDPQPGDGVLDVAAAPGGKATAAAERTGSGGLVVALDRDAGRLRLVREAATRLALPWVVTAVADARRLPARADVFERVLVDAPCSGLGVLRRRPEARWRVEETAIAPLSGLQVAMVVEASRAVRRGGTLVYSVCTLTAAETTGVAQRVLAALDGFSPLARPDGWRPHGPGALLLPQDAGTDGMFVLGLSRE
jgi:16S rRNA (cytosine967-C5)-methyltransferase